MRSNMTDMEKRSNIHMFWNQKDLKAKYECRPSETLTAKDQLPIGNDLFLLRILFPPQDFLIPIRHLGSAIQLTEEVSVIHSTYFSFPTLINNILKKGDPAPVLKIGAHVQGTKASLGGPKSWWT